MAEKKPAAPRKPKTAKGLSGGKLETFKAGDPASAEKFRDALFAGKVGSMGHAGSQWEHLK